MNKEIKTGEDLLIDKIELHQMAKSGKKIYDSIASSEFRDALSYDYGNHNEKDREEKFMRWISFIDPLKTIKDVPQYIREMNVKYMIIQYQDRGIDVVSKIITSTLFKGNRTHSSSSLQELIAEYKKTIEEIEAKYPMLLEKNAHMIGSQLEAKVKWIKEVITDLESLDVFGESDMERSWIASQDSYVQEMNSCGINKQSFKEWFLTFTSPNQQTSPTTKN